MPEIITLSLPTAKQPFTREDAEKLAQLFAKELLFDIGKKKLMAAVLKNEAEEQSDCCHSHDYCDANMAMEAAFIALVGRDPVFQDEADVALWNSGWSIAKKERFFL